MLSQLSTLRLNLNTLDVADGSERGKTGEMMTDFFCKVWYGSADDYSGVHWATGIAAAAGTSREGSSRS